MAEGVEVEIPRATAQKYFCHSCVREVTAKFPDLKCTQCQSDFIEEVPDYHDASDDSDLDIDPPQDLPWLVHELPFRHLIRRTILQTLFDFDQRDAENFPTRAILGEWLRARRSRGEGILPSRREEDDDDDIGVSLFNEIILDANLGDYDFGMEWDSIITQILNESEVSGPPPLPRQQIEAIPIVFVQEEHVNKGVQCTICMEDFKLNEKVKNLPCEHIFHQECIVPWLKMHATCPICRKQIDAEGESNCLEDGLSDSSSTTTTTSSSSSSTGSSSTSTSINSSESTSDTSTNSDSSTETSSNSRRSSNSSLDLSHRLIYPFLFRDA